MITPIGRLYRVLKAAGLAIEGISPAVDIPGGYRVFPESLQSAAQSTIDSFDPNDPVHVATELDRQCIEEFDGGRMFNAVVWALIDRINYPCTVTKFNNSRDKVIEAYKTQPWKA